MSVARVALLLAVPACGSLDYYDPKGSSVDGVDGAIDAPPGGDLDTEADSDTDADSDADADPADTDPTDPTDPVDTDIPTTDSGTGTGTTGTTGTTPPIPVVLALSAVSPDFGSNAGGTTVTATGTFDAATSIEFGGVPGTVLSSTATTIAVLTPATGATGWVDVRAVSGAQSATLPSSYQYWADGLGSSGTFGWMTYVHIVGGYWNNPTDVAGGTFGFTQPAGWELWTDYTPAMGTCQFDYAAAAPPALQDPGAPYVQLSSGATTARFDPLAGTPGAYVPANPLVPNVNVLPGAVYDLDPVAGGADWPGFGITGAVEVPAAFTVSVPDMARPNPPDVFRTTTLNWGGSGGDYVLIYMLRQFENLGGWVNDGVVTCAVPDTGSFTIPVGTWPDWYNNDLLHIQVGRAYQSDTVLPHNNAENRMVGIYWYYGAGNTRR